MIEIIIIAVLIGVWGAFLLWLIHEDENIGSSLVLALLLFIMLFFAVDYTQQKSSTEGYKQGQVDALTGKINYKLTTAPDSTKTWQEVKIK